MKVKETASIRTIVINRLFIWSSVIILVAISLASYFTFHFILDEVGKARLTLLRQINDTSTFYRRTMINSMDLVYSNVYDVLFTSDLGDGSLAETVTGNLLYMRGVMQNTTGNVYSIDIVMNDGSKYYTSEEDKKHIQTLLRSYWYINLFSGERDRSWNYNYVGADNSNLYLSYGRTIFDDSGKAAGVIIISTPNEILSETYRNVLDSSNVIYIMDENGVIISHSNINMIGVLKYDLNYFKNTIRFNTSGIKHSVQGYLLMTNYHDASSGWTVIEEKKLGSIFGGTYSTFFLYSILIIPVSLSIIVALGYLTLKKIVDPLQSVTKQIKEVTGDDLVTISINKHYKEIDVLVGAFNSMIVRITDLIEKRKKQDHEKRRLEFNYLQSQINPHFLHNTLVTIKSLIALGQQEKAETLLEKIMSILRIPLLHYRQFVMLKEEINLIRDYIAIMEYRLEKKIDVELDVPEEFLEIPVPRLILEPFVSNAIYHGFAEREEGDRIWISVEKINYDLYLRVRDNGEGMSQERLDMVVNGKVSDNILSHGIGLQNTRERIKLIYGEESELTITSAEGTGTSVTLILKDFEKLKQAFMK